MDDDFDVDNPENKLDDDWLGQLLGEGAVDHDDDGEDQQGRSAAGGAAAAGAAAAPPRRSAPDDGDEEEEDEEDDEYPSDDGTFEGSDVGSDGPYWGDVVARGSKGGPNLGLDHEETRSRFTEYSMTSSILPRTAGGCCSALRD